MKKLSLKEIIHYFDRRRVVSLLIAVMGLIVLGVAVWQLDPGRVRVSDTIIGEDLLSGSMEEQEAMQVSLIVGQNFEIPDGEEIKAVDISGEDGEEVITQEEGVITGAAPGETAVKVTYQDRSVAEYQFTVYHAVVPSKTEYECLLDGTVDLIPGEDAPITWISSDETIATVNEQGQVSAHAVGDCVITANVNGFQKLEFQITVPEVSLSMTEMDLYRDDCQQLYLVNYKQEFQLTSSDENIVRTEADGWIYGVSPGDAQVSCVVGGREYICDVSVYDGASIKLTLSKTLGEASAAHYYYEELQAPDSQDDYEIVADPDPSYISRGVAVTDEEKAAIIHAITKETGGCKAMCVQSAQTIRDTYLYLCQLDSYHFGTIEGVLRTAFSEDYLAGTASCDNAVWAYEYVFEEGNSFYPLKLVGQRMYPERGGEPALGYYTALAVKAHYDRGDSKLYSTTEGYTVSYNLTNSQLYGSSYVNPNASITSENGGVMESDVREPGVNALLSVGEEMTVELENVIEDYTLTSEDPSIVEVDGTTLRAVGAGTVTITFRTHERMITKTIQVIKQPVVRDVQETDAAETTDTETYEEEVDQEWYEGDPEF